MKINMNEKTLKIVMVAGGFVVGAGTGSGLTLLIMKKKKGPMFHGMTYDQLKYEHNKKRAERKAKKQAEKEVKNVPENKEVEAPVEPVTEIVNDGRIVSEPEPEPEKKPEGEVELVNEIKDEPHWLNEEMYYSKDGNYEKVTLEYYMDDDTFALNDEQVLDILEFNGEQIANFFHAVNVSTIQYPEVFVRNDILKRDYDIHFNWDSYSSAVLGLDPEEEAEPRADDYYSYDNDDDDEDEEDDEFDPLMDDIDEPGGDE